MLVLSRKKNEGVRFDGPGRVIITEISTRQVKLGFEGDDTAFVREELEEKPCEQ